MVLKSGVRETDRDTLIAMCDTLVAASASLYTSVDEFQPAKIRLKKCKDDLTNLVESTTENYNEFLNHMNVLEMNENEKKESNAVHELILNVLHKGSSALFHLSHLVELSDIVTRRVRIFDILVRRTAARAKDDGTDLRIIVWKIGGLQRYLDKIMSEIMELQESVNMSTQYHLL
jgi:hypothetical protein